jgi:tetratricopeptide (TPR) repeat protein
LKRSFSELELIISSEGTSVARFEALLEFGELTSSDDLQRSTDILKDALQTAVALSDSGLEATARLKLATALWKVGDLEECRKQALKGLDLCKRNGDLLGMAHANSSLGIAHGILDDHAVALEFFEKSLKLAEKACNELMAAHALGNMGHIHWCLSDHMASLNCFSKALSIFQNFGDEGLQGVSNMLKSIAGVQVGRGEFEGAVRKLLEALDIDERTGNLRGKVVALHNLGITHMKWGKHGEATDHLHRSLELAERIFYLALRPETHLMLSRAYEAMGETRKALDHIEIYNEFGKETRRKQLRMVDMEA